MFAMKARVAWRVALLIVVSALVQASLVSGSEDETNDPGEDVDTMEEPHQDLEDNTEGEEQEGERASMGEPAPNPNLRFLLVSWVQSDNSPDPKNVFTNVAAVVNPRLAVTLPSNRVEIKHSNSSNWYVHEVRTVTTPQVVWTSKELTVVYHKNFSMTPKHARGLCIIMLDEEAKNKGILKWFTLVSNPMVSDNYDQINDIFGLARCEMAVPSTSSKRGLAFIPMMVYRCVDTHPQNSKFDEYVCAYTRIIKDQGADTDRIMDFGSPLYCGNVLVGVYAGRLNVTGRERAESPKRDTWTEGQLLEVDEQDMFAVPGAPSHYELVSGFASGDLEFEGGLKLKLTDECYKGRHALSGIRPDGLEVSVLEEDRSETKTEGDADMSSDESGD